MSEAPTQPPAPTRAEAFEHRAWRLAYLLTGDAQWAARLAARVATRLGPGIKADPARLDRLVILSARERAARRPSRRRRARKPEPASSPPTSESPEQRARREALAMLPQPREAWILSRVDGVDERWMSRAMDCSRTAALRHLAAAEEHLRERLGDAYDAAAQALRDDADRHPFVPLIDRARTVQRVVRRKRLAIVWGGVVLATLAALLAVLRLRVNV